MKLAASLLVALAGPAPDLAHAEIASVDTPQGLARVEGGRLVIGDRVALGGGGDADPFVWIEAREGTLLLVGTGTGGTACPATWQWVHTGEGDARVTAPFGT